MSKKKMYLITILVGLSVGVITYFTMGSSKVSINENKVFQNESGEFIELTEKKMLYGSVYKSDATVKPIKNVGEGYYKIEQFDDESFDLSELGSVYILLKDDVVYFPLVEKDGEYENIEATKSFTLNKPEVKDER